MNLNEYLNSNGFTKGNMALLPSVGAVINTKTGDVFDLNADNTIDYSDPSCIVDMYNDQFNCEEWFTSLHTLDKSVVDRTLKSLGITTFSVFF